MRNLSGSVYFHLSCCISIHVNIYKVEIGVYLHIWIILFNVTYRKNPASLKFWSNFYFYDYTSSHKGSKPTQCFSDVEYVGCPLLLGFLLIHLGSPGKGQQAHTAPCVFEGLVSGKALDMMVKEKSLSRANTTDSNLLPVGNHRQPQQTKRNMAGQLLGSPRESHLLNMDTQLMLALTC